MHDMLPPDEDGYVLVIGSAGIDVKGYPTALYVYGTPNSGQVRNSVGGVARNIAENLTRLEVPTVLLTAVGTDAEGERVLATSIRAGIDCSHVRQVRGARTGCYMAFVDASMHLHLGISDFEVMQYVDPAYVLQNEALFTEARMVVLDATLSPETLQVIFELARRYNLRVCADPTMPILAGRLCPYLEELYLIVPNAGETVGLCGVDAVLQAEDEESRRQEANKVARQLVQMGVDVAIVTLGMTGLAYADSSGSGFIRAANVETLDPTGAGDAFSAAVIFGILNEVEVDEAMRLGATAAALTLNSWDTVRQDLSQERLYDELIV